MNGRLALLTTLVLTLPVATIAKDANSVLQDAQKAMGTSRRFSTPAPG